MAETAESIKKKTAEFVMQNEGITVQPTTDSKGNECLEWQTSLILEVLEDAKSGGKKSLSRQTVSVQFDLSLDAQRKSLVLFLQWGRIEPSAWAKAGDDITQGLKRGLNVSVRFHEERGVVELGLVYPFHEFDFAYVYKEIVSYFGFVNGMFFKKAN
jgi:hypothetical protein